MLSHELLGQPIEWSKDQNKTVSRLYHQNGVYEIHKYGEGREAGYDVHHLNKNETLRTYVSHDLLPSRKKAYNLITQHK